MGVIDLVLKNKKNKGFTLVELIVAIAVLALLITAVVTMMGHESVILRKSEADISVQNAAQESYNDISDILMQATSVKIEAYVGDDIEFSKKTPGKSLEGGETFTSVSFVRKSNATGAAGEYNFEDSGTKIVNEGSGGSALCLKETTISGTDSTSAFTKLYLKRLIVTYSVPYDSAYKGDSVSVPTGTDKDECTANIIFEGNRIYITKTYKYMTKLDSTYSETDADAKERCLYTSKLNYVKAAGADISAAIATVDVDNQSISLELKFLDNKMTYNVSGITNIKNSYVFIDAK